MRLADSPSSYGAVGPVPRAKRSIISDAARTRDIHVPAFRSVGGSGRERTARILSLQPPEVAVTPSPPAELARENTYLRQRNAQLQGDIIALQSEVEPFRQIVERLHGRSAARPPNPLSEGQ
jgi:hypothetical protein